jgi:LEA14-like dessication related protein
MNIMVPSKHIFLFLALLGIFASCTQVKELQIDKVKSYQFKGFNENKLQFVLFLPIINPNHQSIVVSEIALDTYIKGRAFGKLHSTEKLVIAKNSKRVYEIPITIQVTNILAGISVISDPSSLIESLRFEGYIKARKGLLMRKIEISEDFSDQYIKF